MIQDARGIAVIGDVHGDVNRLRRALDYLPNLVGEIVFVGDYINRGPESRSVVDELIDAKARLGTRLVLLRGNHEHELLRFLSTGDLGRFAAYGGLQTILSYMGASSGSIVQEFIDSFPLAHMRLIQETAIYHETTELLISHSGYAPRDPLDRSLSAMVTGNFPELFDHRRTRSSKDLVICGHYAQYTRQPFVSNYFMCVDTGCGSLPEAPLTAVILPDRRFLHF